LSDIFDDIRRVAEVCDVPDRADKVITQLSDRIEAVRQRASRIVHQPRCFLMEWVDPPFCSGHWGPELVEIAGGYDPLGRKHQPSVQIEWQEVLDARPEIIVLALCGYDIDRAAARLRSPSAISRFRFTSGGAPRPNPSGGRERVLRATRSAYCRQP
jgi:iron complex transport system substrate-binding protein